MVAAPEICSPGSLTKSVASWQGDGDAFLFKLITDPFEPLIVRERDRTGVAVALHLTRRVLDVSGHDFLQFQLHGHAHPCPFREVVHEDVVALLRICPEIEDLRHGGDSVASSHAWAALDHRSAISFRSAKNGRDTCTSRATGNLPHRT